MTIKYNFKCDFLHKGGPLCNKTAVKFYRYNYPNDWRVVQNEILVIYKLCKNHHLTEADRWTQITAEEAIISEVIET